VVENSHPWWCNYGLFLPSNRLEAEKEMVTNKQYAGAALLALGLAISGTFSTLQAAPEQPKTLEEQVRHELLMVPYINVFDNVTYKVDNGVVTLGGQVLRPIDKSNLESAVKHLAGVASVDNQIEVLPLSNFDDRIRLQTLRKIERMGSLYRYFMGVNPSIRIIVKNGNVTLEGAVANAADRQLAFLAANGVPGVSSVTNHLEI
jgi:hyperosmotically inducible periplasmic protein